MDLHKRLRPYEIDDTYYDAAGYEDLIKYILEYSNAHSWFHHYETFVPDSNPRYFHCVVLYWTEGQRPTVNTFNFDRGQI